MYNFYSCMLYHTRYLSKSNGPQSIQYSSLEVTQLKFMKKILERILFNIPSPSIQFHIRNGSTSYRSLSRIGHKVNLETARL